MIDVTQLFIVFVLVFIIAYLVGMGIDYSSRQEFGELVSLKDDPSSVQPKLVVASVLTPDDAVEQHLIDVNRTVKGVVVTGQGEELEEDISKFGELQSGDLIVNEAAVEEFGKRLRAKLGGIEIEEREHYVEQINSIEQELLD